MVETKETQRTELAINESLISPEKNATRRQVKPVVFVGESWTGKTETGKIVAARSNKELVVGDKFFERRSGIESGETSTDLDEHIRFDHFQFRIAEKSLRTGYMPEFYEFRLGGINFAEAMDERDEQIKIRNKAIAKKRQHGKQPPPELNQIDAIVVLFTANKKTRIDRAHKVALDGAKEKNLPRSKWPTRLEVEQKMDERDDVNLSVWPQIHPDYLGNGENPFDPNLERQNGDYVHHIIVKTDNMKNEEEAADYVNLELEKFGVFAKLSTGEADTMAEIIKGEVVFDSTKTGEVRTKKVKNNGKNHPKGSFGGKNSRKNTKAKSGSTA